MSTSTMFFDPLEIPEQLLDAQENGNLVIFAGAGVSMGAPSNLPSFKELARRIAGSHPRSRDLKQYESELDVFLGNLSRDGMNVERICREIIGDSNSKPTHLHRSLVNLYKKPEELRIVTTNFDDHFSAILAEKKWECDRYFSPALPRGDRFSGLVHLHGSIRRFNELVLTDDDFGRAYLHEGWATSFLKSLFSHFAVLFVGYSHNDWPVRYLSRGMSGHSHRDRYAMIPTGEIGLWSSLGISTITYDASNNDHGNLYKGVAQWADFTSLKPTEIAARVKAILAIEGDSILSRSGVAFLRRCVLRHDQVHFFIQEAKGWRWVQWAHEEGLLAQLFEPSPENRSYAHRALVFWLAEQLINEPSEMGLLLVQSFREGPGRQLWAQLCLRIWSDSNLDWQSSRNHKWLILLIHTCPADLSSQLDPLARHTSGAFPPKVFLLLLRFLLRPEPFVEKTRDFSNFLSSDGSVILADKASIDLRLKGDRDSIGAMMVRLLKSHLAETGLPLLTLLEDRIRECHDILVLAGRASTFTDPVCFRGSIYHPNDLTGDHGHDILLESLVALVEAEDGNGPAISLARILTWLDSDVPTLVRVGLYALYLHKSLSGDAKLHQLLERRLVHPAVHSATHESWLILTAVYPTLDSSDKDRLWKAVNEGPQDSPPQPISPVEWSEIRHREVDRLTLFLAERNLNCPIAQELLGILRQRHPDLQSFPGMDRSSFGEAHEILSFPSPKSVDDVLKSPPSELLDWLALHQNDPNPAHFSWEGALDAAGVASQQNADWGISLLFELARREQWKHPLWPGIFWALKPAPSDAESILSLLQFLSGHLADLADLNAFTYFLYDRPSPELDAARPDISVLKHTLSFQIWEHLKAAAPAVTDGFKNHEWLTTAINHPAGRIGNYWLRSWHAELQPPSSPNARPPSWIQGPLADMVAGEDHASQLGRAVLGSALAFLHGNAREWVESQLLPLFSFSTTGEAAFLLWHAHAGFGRFTPELILLMPQLYRQAFAPYSDVRGRLRNGFDLNIASMVASGLFDVNKGDWLTDFLKSIDDAGRTAWARELQRLLIKYPTTARQHLWRNWMKDYWSHRLLGHPFQLTESEAETMLGWALRLGADFSEAVHMVRDGPWTTEMVRTSFYLCSNLGLIEDAPMAVIQLLDWVLKPARELMFFPDEFESILSRLPKKQAYLKPLEDICEHVASLGVPNAAETKARIQREFTT